MIGPEAAALQHDFEAKGFAILRRALAGPLLEAGWSDLQAAQARGEILSCHREGHGVFRSDALARQGLQAGDVAIHDFHLHSPATLAVASHPAFMALATRLLGEDPVLMQSQMLRFGSGKGTHADHVYCPIARPLQTLTVWIAADAVGADNGALYVLPGSHRLPLHRFDGDRLLWPHGEDLDRMREYHVALDAQCEAAGLLRHTIEASAGDVVLLHPRLAHGAWPSLTARRTRRSLVLHLAGTSAYTAYHRGLPGGSSLRRAGRLRYYRPLGA